MNRLGDHVVGFMTQSLFDSIYSETLLVVICCKTYVETITLYTQGRDSVTDRESFLSYYGPLMIKVNCSATKTKSLNIVL